MLAFEDLQWADSSLLDFVEYLLEWSREKPLFILTLARPELQERRPSWGAGQRNFSALYLEPLARGAMQDLLAGLVPGLPDELRDQILERAEGVPLYAVETVRMLLDRGLLAQDGPAYRPTGAIESLEVPETLHALIAARLDGLSAEERRVLQDAAVLGKTFSRDALAALLGLQPSGPRAELLGSLARKEVLSMQADPRSPERGQYGFLQDLVRHVAYETLSRRDRRTAHLAAAAHLEGRFAERTRSPRSLASHYVAAYEAVPDSDDAHGDQGEGALALIGAGKHAESLAAAAEARHYYEQAAALAASELDRAKLLAVAGDMAGRAGGPQAARPLLEEAIAIFEAAGDTHAAARASMDPQAATSSSPASATKRWRTSNAPSTSSPTTSPDEAFADLAAMLSRAYWFSGDLDRAASYAEIALDVAEKHRFMEPLTHALRAKGAVLFSRGHLEESTALFARGLELALEHGFAEHASRSYFILSDKSFRQDRYPDALGYLEQSLTLARKMGSRPWEAGVLSEMTYPLWMLGRWDEVVAAREGVRPGHARRGRRRSQPASGRSRGLRAAGRAGRGSATVRHVCPPRALPRTCRTRARTTPTTAALRRAEGRLPRRSRPAPRRSRSRRRVRGDASRA